MEIGGGRTCPIIQVDHVRTRGALCWCMGVMNASVGNIWQRPGVHRMNGEARRLSVDMMQHGKRSGLNF